MHVITALRCSAAVLLGGGMAACGQQGSDAPAGALNAADVVVRVDADGKGARPPVIRTVRCRPMDRGPGCRAIRGAPPATWSPVPADRICTQVYGGPERARVTGMVGGRRVDAELSRTDGCEIERWQQLAPLLDPLARGG